MPEPRAIIAEDEAILGEELRTLLSTLWPELVIAPVARHGIEALQQIERHRPDVVFLDIELPGLGGLDVARQCDGQCHVVFVTAYDAHAVAAFELGAIDYVLKPYDTARIASTIQRVKRRLDSAPTPLGGALRELSNTRATSRYLRWINAAQGEEVRLITVDEICYFQADTKYTRVVTADAEPLIRRSLKELQDELDPAMFWQIHRSTIVNANAIAGVTRTFGGRTFLKLKSRSERLPVSAAHEHLFKQM